MFSTSLISFPLHESHFRVVHSEIPFEYDPSLYDEIEAIWRQGKLKYGDSLFNGKVAHLSSYNSSLIEIQFIEYKLFYAWFHSAFIKLHLPIFPIGIQAFVECNGSFLIGKRSERVAFYQDLLEPIPSGSIDFESCKENREIDLLKLVLRELIEEAGISVHRPISFIYKSLVWTESGLWDIVCRLSISMEEAQRAIKNSEECTEIRWISQEELKKSAQAASGQYIPGMRKIIDIL
ncbi:MAG: NUDIX domain-containing protein [Chlamydia sp.]